MKDESTPGNNGVISQEDEALLFRALVDSMNDGFGIINAEGVFTYVNERFASMLELQPEQMQGKPLIAFVKEASRKTVLENMNRRSMGHSSQYELEWSKASGDSVATIVSGVPLIDKDRRHSGSFAVITDITKLKNSQKKLRETLEKFRRIFDESPIGVELFDADGLLIDANKAALDIGGITDKSDLVGFSLYDDPNLPDGVKARLRRGENIRHEVEFDFSKVVEAGLYDTKRTGKIHLDSVITPMGIGREGGIQGYLVQLLECTERREAEERYRLIAEHISDVLWTADMDFKLTYVTPSAKRLLGYEPEELVGQSLLDQMTPESVRTAVSAMASAVKDEEQGKSEPRGGAPALEIQLKRKDGTEVWTETTRTFLRDINDEPIAIIGTARNIEDRRAAELAMVASESKYRHLVEQSFQGLVIVLHDPLSVAYVNRTFAGFLGRTQEEVLQFDADDIQRVVHIEDWQNIMKRMEELIGGDTPESIPLVMRVFRKDGSMRWLEIFGRIVQYDNNPAVQIVAMDVTDRHISEKRVKTQKDRAMLYLDLMSHDFRNQLQIILGSTMIMESMLREPDSRRLLGQIVSAVERCQSMISKVKVTEPLMSVALRPRRLDSAIASVADRYSQSHKDTIFEVDIQVDMAIADSDQFLELLITNIIENAVQHNARPDKRVWITLREASGGYTFSVADNGEGISDSLRTSIFDVSRRYGGVGLHQAKQICEKYGCRIEVRDRVSGQPCNGAEFVIYFPMAKQQLS